VIRHLMGAAFLVSFVLSMPLRTAAVTEESVIVALGDSLTAGLGVAPDEAYPARLGARLRRDGYRHRVVNAGVSGDTTAGALRRLPWVLRARPAIVIVALGANDGLRGQHIPAMQRNLEQIVARCRDAGARVLLAGMRLPPNYGDYASAFARVFPEVARRTKVRFIPFLLDGVAADRGLNQADGVHPNAAGHAVIAEHVWSYLHPLLAPPPERTTEQRSRRGGSWSGRRRHSVPIDPTAWSRSPSVTATSN
jgi:acyl-CoA thioesterase-1